AVRHDWGPSVRSIGESAVAWRRRRLGWLHDSGAGDSWASRPPGAGAGDRRAAARRAGVVRDATGERLTIDVRWQPGDYVETMIKEVRQGLGQTPRTLPSKYFYDDRGSELFEEITRLPEYYQTRTEGAILESITPELMGEGLFQELLEIGSG